VRKGNFMKYGKISGAVLLWGSAFLIGLLPVYGSVLKATPNHVEFGTLDEGKNAVIMVTIHNTGKAPIDITNVQTNCACTEAELGKRALSPGEKTELKVTYITQGRPGPFDKNVVFTTNIPGEEKIEIFTMTGNVREAPGPKIAATPRRVTLEGADLSAGKKQSFTIKNEGSLPLVITSMRSKDGKNVYYDGAKDGDITIDPGQSKDVELQLKGKDAVSGDRELILVDSNAINAGQTGLFLMIQYSN